VLCVAVRYRWAQFSGQGPLRLNVEQQMPVSQQREGVTANLIAPLMSEALVAASRRLRDNMVKRVIERDGLTCW
jgi:hypothetical protein